jgi:hypothetical protein
VEQPYCILELNHPKQIHQTGLAKNGLNPYVYSFCSTKSSYFLVLFSFWDERFLFECDDKSNQIHLQIVDRKKTNTKMGNNYGLLIHFEIKTFCLFFS